MTTPPTLEQIARETATKLAISFSVVAGRDLSPAIPEIAKTILTALQTATKQPEGADWAEAAAKEFLLGVKGILAEAHGTSSQTPPSFEVKILGDFTDKLAAIIRKHAPKGILLPSGVTDMPEDAYLPSPEDQEAKQKFVDDQFRKHAPLMANREDSERLREAERLLAKCHGWFMAEISRRTLNESEATGVQSISLEISRFLDAAMRPAQPERGQGEGT